MLACVRVSACAGVCTCIPSSPRLSPALTGRRALTSIALVAAIGLSACGSKEKPASQSLVVVNGQEITVHQVNDELMRANVQIPPDQKEAAAKQLLETLVDRQLLQAQALNDKIDRDPAVMQAIERAKSQIIAQAYLQKRLANNGKPSKDEIQAYFVGHPEIFSQRKAFDMSQLIIASKDFSSELKDMIGSSKSLDEIAAWFSTHKVEFVRNRMTKSTAEMPLELVKKLQVMNKGQLLVVQEGDRHVLVAITQSKDIPVTAAVAEQQIGQFLMDKKNKESAQAELTRLRAQAKIEYLNQPKLSENQVNPVMKTELKADSKAGSKAAIQADTKPEASSGAESKPTQDALKRGVAGL
jgi:peptidyl-prolyl cis-trans isomerase C